MKAAQVKNYGGTEAIEVVTDAQTPVAQAGQVAVEVHAASLNRIDSVIRNGYMQQMLTLAMPLTLGGDFAGVVTEVGEGVTEFKVGDKVFGNAGAFKGGTGSLAEVVVAKVANMALAPTSLDFGKAAALPLVGTSALQGLEEELDVEPNQKILIQGGAGGIGALAIQMAKMLGAYVATTVASADVEFAKSLGADEVIDYKTQDVTQVVKDYDGVFDTAGGEGMSKLFAILKKGGKLVTMAGKPDQTLAEQAGVTAVGQMTKVSPDQLQELAALVDSGRVKVQVEKAFSLDQTREAFDYFETQHPKGKVVVEVK